MIRSFLHCRKASLWLVFHFSGQSGVKVSSKNIWGVGREDWTRVSHFQGDISNLLSQGIWHYNVVNTDPAIPSFCWCVWGGWSQKRVLVVFGLPWELRREMPRFCSLTSVRHGPTAPPWETSSTSERAKGQNCSWRTTEEKFSIDVCSLGVRNRGMQFCMVVLIQLKML